MSEAQKLSFTFEGQTVSAEPGQSIAGALQATGKRTLSRGVKYHRPRGYTCGFGACGDCPMQIDGMPATVSCTTPVAGGEVVRREGGLPGVGFDLLRTADLMRPFLKAGFQFKLFAQQPRLSKLAGSVLAVLAGGGKEPSVAAVEQATIERVEHHVPDVLVIGAGASGVSAAIAAADAGASVLLVDQEFIGGRGRVRTEVVTLGDAQILPSEVVGDLLVRAHNHASIECVHGTAIGLIDGLVPVISRSGRVRHEVRASALIVATGSYETPIMMAGHDLPGVMLADGALRLAAIEGVTPGKRAVVVADDERSSDVAAALTAHGVAVVAEVPAASIARVTGWGRATGVRLTSGKRIRADLVCMVGERRAAEELALHAAYSDAGSHELIASDAAAQSARGRIAVIGSAAGNARYSLDVAAAAGTAAASAVLRPIQEGEAA